MDEHGIRKTPVEKIDLGGKAMDCQEIEMGQAAYDVQRVYNGKRPIQELVIDKIGRTYLAQSTFDGDTKDTV